MRVFPSNPSFRTVAPRLVAVACLALAGCQSPAGPGASLASDASDPCAGERAAFAGSKTYFQDQIATAAATGGAVGAGFGALTGLAATGNLRGALIGGVTGGVVGAAAGASSAYYNTLWQRARDQDEVANTMNQDLAQEGQQIDHTTATFARLRYCRFAQAWATKQQVRHHELDRATGLARIGYNRDKFAEEVRIAHEFGLTMEKRDQQFQEAANDLRAPPPASADAPAPRRASSTHVAQVNRAASVSVPEKRQSFDSTVASAEKSSKAAFDIDSDAHLTWVMPYPFDA